ncbi:Tex family protein [Halonatronum saccharophilum]|uniref:Tex family protein n=1 Tax=Halonatronum saccharophilum TaxID=150060 RepID=UPI0004B312E9|nr:Tex family protein [Halonatronum saccharophilum]
MKINLEKVLADELKLNLGQVKRTINLLDEGNTIPFIARYRKEMTGNLDETQLRNLNDRLDYLRRLEERKEEVLASIDKQDKLTEELERKIGGATKLQEVEDLYRPYKQKRKTRATKAKEKGLDPLAQTFLAQEVSSGSLEELAQKFVDEDKGLDSIEDVLAGVRDIIAEYVADSPESRQMAREITFNYGTLLSELKVEPKERTPYEDYYEYKEGISKVPPYRTMAINRGEKEGVLRIKVGADEDRVIKKLEDEFITGNSIFKEEIKEAIADAYKRLVGPAIEREVRNYLTDKAEDHAIDVFVKNLRNLLLQPPLSKVRVLAIDPAYRTGCKVVVLNQFGDFLEKNTIYPHSPQERMKEAKEKLIGLIKEYKIEVVAIGNGTASRETELMVAEIIEEVGGDLKYIIISEAGASVYSASPLAKKEFPELNVSIRGAISIGRRLQDPLAELVKIDPKSIGVGMYQHDISSVKLEKSLGEVVESVVNHVGVDLNTASTSLLEYVAGINSSVAKNIIKYREENGGFKSRKELKEVYRLGPKTFLQAAGFLKVKEGNNPLDQTSIHPESYSVAKKLLEDLGFGLESLKDKNELRDLREKIKDFDLKEVSEELDIGMLTLKDIVDSVLKPGRDPREDLAKPIFRSDILKLEELKEGMILQGTVRNVVDFGAFVDVGVKEDGLVHISQMSNEYVEDPLDIVEVGDVVEVKVLSVELERGRISLTMKG